MNMQIRYESFNPPSILTLKYSPRPSGSGGNGTDLISSQAFLFLSSLQIQQCSAVSIDDILCM